MDFVAPQLLVWHLDSRKKRVFLTGKDANFERFSFSVPAVVCGGASANLNLVMERHKEEALTLGRSPELIKNAIFQANASTKLWIWLAADSFKWYRDFLSAASSGKGIELGKVDVQTTHQMFLCPEKQLGWGFFPFNEGIREIFSLSFAFLQR